MNEHPGKLLLSILGVLILLLVIGNIGAHSHSHQRTAAGANQPLNTWAQTVGAPANRQPPPPTPSTPITEIQGQDRFYSTRRFREYERNQQITRPAYQHLPYRTNQVHIVIANVTSDGQIVLSVSPLGPNVNPQVEYGKFLARYHDPGSAYLPLYGRYGN